MAKGDETPRTNPAEIESLIEQIRGTNLEPGAKEKVERLLRTVLTLVELLGRRNISIKKLRQMIFGRRTEKHHGKKAEGKDQKSEFGPTDNESTKASGEPEAQGEQNSAERTEKSHRKGHGRRAASEYSGSKKVHCQHGQLKAG